MKKLSFITSTFLSLASLQSAAIENLLYHEIASVKMTFTLNGSPANQKDFLSPRSPLRAKGDAWNCQDNHGLRNKSGTVFLGSPRLDVLPLTYTFDYDYWTLNCHTEGHVFYLALQQPTPDFLRKRGYQVNDYYEAIHDINPEKIVRLPDIREILTKDAKGSYECRLYDNKIDNGGVFYGCVTLAKSSENNRYAESKLSISVNIVDSKPINVAKRFPKKNSDSSGTIVSVTLYGSRVESNGIVAPTVKPVTIPYSEYLTRAVTIDDEDYIYTD